LWIGGLERCGLMRRLLFYALPLIRRQTLEAFL
jgi:hypothetical protein